MKVIIDHARGSFRIDEATDVVEIARTALGNGVTAHDAAVRMFGADSPSRAVVEKARRRLESKVDIGMLERIDDSPVRYRPA